MAPGAGRKQHAAQPLELGQRHDGLQCLPLAQHLDAAEGLEAPEALGLRLDQVLDGLHGIGRRMPRCE